MSFFKVSIHTWLSSPSSFLIGIGYPDLDQSENLRLIAGHSEIFDFLGAYGIVGVIVYSLLIVSFFKLVYNSASEKVRYFAIVVPFMTLTYALVSGLSGTPVIGLALFWCFPLFYAAWRKTDEQIIVYSFYIDRSETSQSETGHLYFSKEVI